MMNGSAFDYKFLGSCQYPVPAKWSASGETDCGERAIAKGWWTDDSSDVWLLCVEHLKFILETEKVPKRSWPPEFQKEKAE